MSQTLYHEVMFERIHTSAGPTEVSTHTALWGGGMVWQVYASICYKYWLHPTLHQWEYLWTSSNKKQESIWIPSDITQEEAFWFQYKQREAKTLTSASLAKSHFEPLCLTCTPRANTAIWLAHPAHHPLWLDVYRGISGGEGGNYIRFEVQ